MILCLVLCFAGCSSKAPKKKSTAPIMFVFCKICHSYRPSSFSLFINEDGEYFTVGSKGTYLESEFNKLSDVPSFEKPQVSNGTLYTELSEYEVEGQLFNADEVKELTGLLEKIPSDPPCASISMPKYDSRVLPEKQTILLTAKTDGSDPRWLLSLFNTDGGERRKFPNTYIGDCINDENSMKIVSRIMEKVPLKDAEKEYFSVYPDYLNTNVEPPKTLSSVEQTIHEDLSGEADVSESVVDVILEIRSGILYVKLYKGPTYKTTIEADEITVDRPDIGSGKGGTIVSAVVLKDHKEVEALDRSYVEGQHMTREEAEKKFGTLTRVLSSSDSQ